MLRMRQICLVAEDLDTIEAHLRGVFGLQICYRDEGVAAFGLHNFLMPIGNSFLEVVSPTRAGDGRWALPASSRGRRRLYGDHAVRRHGRAAGARRRARHPADHGLVERADGRDSAASAGSAGCDRGAALERRRRGCGRAVVAGGPELVAGAAEQCDQPDGRGGATGRGPAGDGGAVVGGAADSPRRGCGRAIRRWRWTTRSCGLSRRPTVVAMGLGGLDVRTVDKAHVLHAAHANMSSRSRRMRAW